MSSEIINSAYSRFMEQCHFPKDQPDLSITFNCTDEESSALFRIQDELNEQNSDVLVSVTRINKLSWNIYMTQSVGEKLTDEQKKYSKRATIIREILREAHDNPTNSSHGECELIELSCGCCGSWTFPLPPTFD